MKLGEKEKFLTITDGHTPVFYIGDAALHATLKGLLEPGILRPDTVPQTTQKLYDQLDPNIYTAGVVATFLIRMPTDKVNPAIHSLDILQREGGEALLIYPSPTQPNEMDAISEVDTLTPLTARIRHIVPEHYPDQGKTTIVGVEVDLLIPDLILLFAHGYIDLIQPPE